MTFNPNLFTAEAVKYLSDNKMSLVSINTPTYPVDGRSGESDPNLSYIKKNNLAMLRNEKD